jgi:hypothetical protein
MDSGLQDEREQRCPMLGHPVPFRYCRQLPEGRPCRLIIDCWQGRFDVVSLLQERYTPEEIGAILAPPKPKLTSIVELIERAKKGTPRPDGSE